VTLNTKSKNRPDHKTVNNKWTICDIIETIQMCLLFNLILVDRGVGWHCIRVERLRESWTRGRRKRNWILYYEWVNVLSLQQKVSKKGKSIKYIYWYRRAEKKLFCSNRFDLVLTVKHRNLIDFDSPPQAGRIYWGAQAWS